MSKFTTMNLAQAEHVFAPDGSQVTPLLASDGGSMACFELAAGTTSRAIAHHTVEELWFVHRGSGEIWRRHKDDEELTPLVPGVCISIPPATHFQFRASQHGPLLIVGVTMPPWPGEHEARYVDGPWAPGETEDLG